MGAIDPAAGTSQPQPAARARVLVVESNAAVALPIRACLEQDGWAVAVVETAAAMRDLLTHAPVDVVILDLVLSGEDGWGALRWLRGRCALPVILLTPRADPLDRAVGIELGAADCLATPIDPGALLARLRTIERRPVTVSATLPPAAHAEIRFADWTLDVAQRRLVSECGGAAHLTQSEYRLLVLLASNPRRVVSRSELMGATAGREWVPFDRSIDVHISNLRRKIDPDPRLPSLIRTVRGTGYMFVPDSSRPPRPEA